MGPLEGVPGLRPRPNQCRGAGGLQEGARLSESVTAEELRTDIARLDRHLAFLGVRVAGDGDPDLRVPLARSRELAPAWIEAYREVTIAQSGTSPKGMPAAFVLQYQLNSLATVIATAAMRSTWVLDADPALWSFRLDPTFLYPVTVQIRPGRSRRIIDDVDRLDEAWEGYRETATAIATDLPTPERMSSRQRLGMVEDMWEQALARLEGAGPPPRRSCCLMYALPGLDACAGCPRRV